MKLKVIIPAIALTIAAVGIGGYQMLLARNADAASAVSHQPFSTAAFAAAQKADKRILVDVWASWCPVCARQQPGIAAAQKQAGNGDVVVFRLDYDKQNAEQKPFKITRQSTLIAYRGTRETGRLIAATDPAAIAKLIESSR